MDAVAAADHHRVFVLLRSGFDRAHEAPYILDNELHAAFDLKRDGGVDAIAASHAVVHEAALLAQALAHAR